MHLLVINCSPRVVEKSNTNIILGSFLTGWTEQGNTAELYHLSQRGTWEEIRRAFAENDRILMAIPLFVECIPGLMMEFLEGLPPKTGEGERTRLSFLLQGGFSEASQLRCCERYLEQLPAKLGCEYGGTLIKGEMFMTHLFPPEVQRKGVEPFAEMGRALAQDGLFTKDKADAFAGPEYLPRSTQVLLTVLDPVKKLFFELYFKKLGCKWKLTAKPFES